MIKGPWPLASDKMRYEVSLEGPSLTPMFRGERVALRVSAEDETKAAADRRKVAGLAEAQANAARARARLDGGEDADDDSGQTAAIDAWVVDALQRNGVKARCVRGRVDLDDVPAKWNVIVRALRRGIHAAARGQELPDLELPVVQVKMDAYRPAVQAAPKARER